MSPAQNKSTIAKRMEDYFQRQIAHFETILNELSGSQQALDTQDLDVLARHRQKQEKTTRTLADEFWSLKREWDADNHINPAGRTNVRKLAVRADKLSQTLQDKIGDALDISSEHSRTLQASLGKMRHGKEFLAKFKAEEPGQHDFIDRKA